MGRMMSAGYSEDFRKISLKRAIAIHDKMKENDVNGIQPIHRPKDWQQDARHKEKKRKRYNWSTKGGFIAPIFIPATPNG